MQRKYEISVVTVCRNVLPLLQQTVASVKSQTFSDYEYIVIDGASTDGTKEWLQQQTIDTIISEPDGGIYDAMNKAVGLARGEWIIFMNAGDTFCNTTTLNEVAPYLQSTYGIVYGDIEKVVNGQLIRKPAEEPYNAHRMFCCHQAMFTRTYLLRQTPFDITHRYSADFKFVKQQYKAGIAMLHIPVKVAVFDTHGVSNQNRNNGLEDNVAVIRELDTGVRRFCNVARLQWKIYWNKLRGKA